MDTVKRSSSPGPDATSAAPITSFCLTCPSMGACRPDSIKEAAQQVEKEVGSIKGLVNNAGRIPFVVLVSLTGTWTVHKYKGHTLYDHLPSLL